VKSSLPALTAEERGLLRPAPPPRGSSAMKATLTRERFSDPNWVFERKLDGIRCIAVRSGAEVSLLSRNDLSMNTRYPEVADALASQRCESFAVDGEIVAFDGSATSFARLAQRRQHYVPVFFYAFDLLWLQGSDIRALPWRTRKQLLRRVLSFADPLRLTQHRNGDGKALFQQACQKGWEGLIAKRADSSYGERRSRDWLKLKCEQGQELVIGGYTAPRGSRTEFGALLLGYHDNGLRYAGKVGTGFDRATLSELGRALRERCVDDPPFVDAANIRERGVTWVRPSLVAQVGFSEWTDAGRLRHPRFLGLREDKSASRVVREQ
jgi:bifunctional non-homologous end joining protein LigD